MKVPHVRSYILIHHDTCLKILKNHDTSSGLHNVQRSVQSISMQCPSYLYPSAMDSHGMPWLPQKTSSIVKQIMVSHAPCPFERILKYCKVLACTNASQVHLEAFGLSSQGIRISPHLNNVKMCKGN